MSPPPMNGSLCWHQIPVLNLERAKTFYTDALKFTFHPTLKGATAPGLEDTVALFNMEGPGSSVGGNLQLVDGPITKGSANGIIIFMFVYDIEETLKKIEEAGGKVIKGVHPQGEMGIQAYVEDTEGNFFGVWQPSTFDFTKCEEAEPVKEEAK